MARMARRRKIDQIDSETGEMLSGSVVAVVQQKQRNGFYEGWVAMGQNAMKAMAQADIGDEARRVFFVIAASIDYENWIQISQSELANSINMKRSSFSRAIKRLEKEGVILRGPKIGRCSTFRLNPSFGWKGSARNHQKALRERMHEKGMSVVEKGDAHLQKDAFE